MFHAFQERLLAMANRSGRWPARLVTWSLTGLFSVWVVLDVLAFGMTRGLPQTTYDAMTRARFWAAAPDPRIIIIDIDESSLSRMSHEFGRWPWPRDTLATLLEFIEKQAPTAVVWDIVFSDADRLSPGGDAAFEAAVRRSPNSHFSIIRLPPKNDHLSQINQTLLPPLWAKNDEKSKVSASPSPVAMVAPALEAVARSSLGYNNGYVDKDGVLRRYRYAERLPDGSVIQSLAMSVLKVVDERAFQRRVEDSSANYQPRGELISWREQPNAYPRVAFADVFALAEGAKPWQDVPSLAGKIIIIGSTAPSLHDIHPTPLSPVQAGVDSLATAIDNAINDRSLHELPGWVKALLAVVLCLALAMWVQFNGVSSLAPALLVLPAGLMATSYLSLNGSPLFLDLQLPATLTLILLGMLRYWNGFRRNHWCNTPSQTDSLLLWCLKSRSSWSEESIDHLIDALEQHASQCRILVGDCQVYWPAKLRWPELSRYASIIGPQEALENALPALRLAIKPLIESANIPQPIASGADRKTLASLSQHAWAQYTPSIN